MYQSIKQSWSPTTHQVDGNMHEMKMSKGASLVVQAAMQHLLADSRARFSSAAA
jgi:hypothetical protein